MMHSISKVMAILGLTIVLSGVAPIVQAQASQAVVAQAKVTDLLNQGQAKAKRGDYQGAIVAYNQAIQVNPKHTDAYIYRGLARHDLGDLSRAKSDFEQAVHLEDV